MTETDVTKRPLKMPERFIPYMEKYRIYQLFKDMTRDLVLNLPKDHLKHIKIYLNRHRSCNKDVDQVIVLVSPDLKIDIKKLAQDLIKDLGLFVITRQCVMDRYEKHDEYTPGCISPVIMADVTRRLVMKDPVKTAGWFMFDHPCTVREARCLQQEGVLPTVTLVLSPTPPLTAPAPNSFTPCRSFFQQDFEGLKYTYRATVKDVFIDPEDDEDKIVHKCMNGIRACNEGAQGTGQGYHVVGAPGVYRVLLIGPHGSGRRTQAKALAKHFNLVHLHFDNLFGEAHERKDDIAQTLHTQGASMKLKAEIVHRRILQKDCLEQGWVLTGYPMNGAEFEKLDQMETPPNRIIFLNADENTCKDRRHARAVDWCTGQEVPRDSGPRAISHPENDKKRLDAELDNYFTEALVELRAAAGITGVVVDALEPFDMAKTNKEKEDRLAQQRLCKRRRYAEIKSDPRLYATEKEKQRKRYLKRKAEKKITGIAEKNRIHQKQQRMKWQENSRRYRQSKKEEGQKLPEPVQIDIKENQEIIIKENLKDPLKRVGERIYMTKEVALIVRRVRYKEQKKQRYLRETIKILKRQNALYRMRELRRRQSKENINKTPTENESLELKTTYRRTALPKFKKPKKTSKKLLQSKVSDATRKTIYSFYNDDNNSVIRPGKKEFITKNKIRHQKRFLTATLTELYKKFIKETNINIHYSTFCKERPFWVLFSKPQNRDTCLCIVHTNMDLLINALSKAKILKFKNSADLLKALCCDPKEFECLERTCAACAARLPEYMEFSNHVLVTYYEWKRVNKEITTNKGIVKKQQMTSKEKETEEPLKLIKKMETALPNFFLHCYKILKQYTVMKNLRENQLRFDEAMIHVDFSENYALKYAEEVQSFHFAGSRSQVSLHTAVIYTHDFSIGTVKPTCVCTVSKCTRHDVPAIWAHLIPLLQEAYKQNPFIEIIHFLSDSPSSQYRNKNMFYVISQISIDFPQIKRVSWNYSESGHGKGAPDGVGAVLKRTADQMVRFGQDVGSFSQFCDTMNDCIENIVIKGVEEVDVTEKEKKIPKDLKPFKGTLSVHQVIWDKYHRFTTMRSISCFLCDAGEICHHSKHLGFIENKKTVPDPSHLVDYDFVIPLSQTKLSIPRTVTSKPSCGRIQKKNISDKTTGTNKLLEKKIDRQTHADVENQPSCSNSIITSNKGKTIPAGKRIHVLSDITIDDLNQLIKKKKRNL